LNVLDELLRGADGGGGVLDDRVVDALEVLGQDLGSVEPTEAFDGQSDRAGAENEAPLVVDRGPVALEDTNERLGTLGQLGRAVHPGRRDPAPVLNRVDVDPQETLGNLWITEVRTGLKSRAHRTALSFGRKREVAGEAEVIGVVDVLDRGQGAQASGEVSELLATAAGDDHPHRDYAR